MAAHEAFVTGGSGFIGSHLIEVLVSSGWRVRCLVRPGSRREHLSARAEVSCWDGDLSDLARLREGMQGCQAVFHVAGYYALWSPEPELFHQTNVVGTENVLEAAALAEVPRVVHTSSVACIGEAPPGGLATEDTPVGPADLACSAYKRSKHEAERIAMARAAAGQDVVIVNPSSTIGPGDSRPTPTGRILLDFLRGDMPAYLDTGLNFVDVRDVARGHLLAYERGGSGRRYILGNRAGNMTLKSFFELASRVANRPSPRVKIPYRLAWVAGAASTLWADVTGRPPRVPLAGVRMAKHRMYFDPSRALRELGLPQTPLHVTVADAVRWFQEHLLPVNGQVNGH